MNHKLSKLPRDRSKITTEQRNPRSMKLHELSVAECLEHIAAEDEQIFAAIEIAKLDITSFVQALEPRFRQGGRLIYIGAGTSGRLGVLDAAEMPPTFQINPDRIIGIIAGGDRSLRLSSEGLEDDAEGARNVLSDLKLTKLDTLLGIAAGGTTPYVHGALLISKELEPLVLTGLLTCSAPLDRVEVDHLLYIPTGPEVITGSTRMKAGTATKLALNMISTTLMIRSGRVYQNLMVDLKASNAKLRDRAARIIAMLTDLPREECFDLLNAADGEVKIAIVMNNLQISSGKAREILNKVDGRLDKAS